MRVQLWRRRDIAEPKRCSERWRPGRELAAAQHRPFSLGERAKFLENREAAQRSVGSFTDAGRASRPTNSGPTHARIDAEEGKPGPCLAPFAKTGVPKTGDTVLRFRPQP